MRQSSRLPPPLLACFVALVVGVPAGYSPLQGQVQYLVRRAENFRRAPSAEAPVLARVTGGVRLEGTGSEGQWVEVTLEGWIWAPSVQIAQGDHDLRVSVRGGENLRGVPNGQIFARLSNGTLLDEFDRRGNWIRVRRTAWMWARSLERLDETAQPLPDSSTSVATTTGGSATSLEHAVTAQASRLLNVPEGQETATLAAGAPVKVLARSGEWIRIQTEGWVRESDLKASAPGVLEGVSGAEVRARPDEYQGKLLQWTVQFLAIQEADELRSEIPEGQSYMLARGPLPEAGFVYIMLPPARLDEVERLEPLAQLVIIGRVRTGRSRYLGNPILELVDWAVRQQ